MGRRRKCKPMSGSTLVDVFRQEGDCCRQYRDCQDCPEVLERFKQWKLDRPSSAADAALLDGRSNGPFAPTEHTLVTNGHLGDGCRHVPRRRNAP